MLNDMRQEVAMLMKAVAPNCNRMTLVCRWENPFLYSSIYYLACRWHGEFRNCSEMFKVTKTDDGFCCSFNTVSLSQGFAKPPPLDDNSDEINDYDYGEEEDEGDYLMFYDDEYTDAAASDTSAIDTNANDTSDVGSSSTEYSESWLVLFKFFPCEVLISKDVHFVIET